MPSKTHSMELVEFWKHYPIVKRKEKKKKKKKKLRKAEELTIRGGVVGRVSQLKWEINGLLIKEEKMWRQRSRTLWLYERDQNTRFFHNQASHRYKRNRIKEMQSSRGEVCKDEEGIAQILINHYHELFHSANRENIEHVLSAIPTLVTLELNNMLSAEFVKKEVDEALKQMDPLKAPGPDGLPPLFFQKFWLTTREEVSHAVLTCLNSGSITFTINRTFITLI